MLKRRAPKLQTRRHLELKITSYMMLHASTTPMPMPVVRLLRSQAFRAEEGLGFKAQGSLRATKRTGTCCTLPKKLSHA